MKIVKKNLSVIDDDEVTEVAANIDRLWIIDDAG